MIFFCILNSPNHFAAVMRQIITDFEVVRPLAREASAVFYE